MKIGVVCPYDIGKPGGVQQLSGELAKRLREMGEDVVFVGAGVSWLPGGPDIDDMTVAVGRTTSVPANRSKAPVTLSPRAWRRARRALSEVDVVHIHEPLVPIVGWAALSLDVPTVATFHSDAPDWVAGAYRWAPWVGRRLRRATITAVSETAARVIPDPWGVPEIVPNAIDVDAYDVPVARSPNQVAFLGRDEPRKGLEVLLRAWPAVRSAAPDAELVVMGARRDDGPTGTRFTGPVSGEEKRRLLASSQVYVAPNLGGESFGIVVLEAMAAGCAVVASDIPGFVDIAAGAVEHVPAGDPVSLARAITGLLDDDARSRSLGEAARRRAREFDWPLVASRYLDLYAEATS
ncbi:MAG TPA: glycosyltransferase family 4 protein [Acidimicrobiia bacterium]|nr:glycosyltransferase family 4 protein [Acidimicrobiia bacterium]